MAFLMNKYTVQVACSIYTPWHAKTVFALTFADAICIPIPKSIRRDPNYNPASYFNQRTQEWQDHIRKVFRCCSSLKPTRFAVEVCRLHSIINPEAEARHAEIVIVCFGSLLIHTQHMHNYFTVMAAPTCSGTHTCVPTSPCLGLATIYLIYTGIPSHKQLIIQDMNAGRYT